jgi:hypothetical protein
MTDPLHHYLNQHSHPGLRHLITPSTQLDDIFTGMSRALCRAELAMVIEDMTGRVIGDAELEAWQTVGDVYEAGRVLA